MKEIIAIVRSSKIKETKDALRKAGAKGYTSLRVYGRGRQRGLRYPSSTGEEDGIFMRYLPKRLFSVVVEDHEKDAVVEAILRANSTGNYGDGKIFVLEVNDAWRISTDERGEEAVR